jgi:hypothetical protein
MQPRRVASGALDDTWLRATFLVAIAHAALLAVVHARPVIAVFLWWIGPSLIALMVAALLLALLASSLRSGVAPTGAQLVGFVVLLGVMVALATFRAYPSSYDRRPSDIGFRLPLGSRVRVAWGGSTIAVNYHVVIPINAGRTTFS